MCERAEEHAATPAPLQGCPHGGAGGGGGQGCFQGTADLLQSGGEEVEEDVMQEGGVVLWSSVVIPWNRVVK